VRSLVRVITVVYMEEAGKCDLSSDMLSALMDYRILQQQIYIASVLF